MILGFLLRVWLLAINMSTIKLRVSSVPSNLVYFPSSSAFDTFGSQRTAGIRAYDQMKKSIVQELRENLLGIKD